MQSGLTYRFRVTAFNAVSARPYGFLLRWLAWRQSREEKEAQAQALLRIMHVQHYGVWRRDILPAHLASWDKLLKGLL